MWGRRRGSATLSAGSPQSAYEVNMQAFRPLGELWAKQKNDLFASAVDEAVEDTVQSTVQAEFARLVASFTSGASPAAFSPSASWMSAPPSPRATKTFVYGQQATAKQIQMAKEPVKHEYDMNPKNLAAKQYGVEARRLALLLYPQCKAADGKGDVPAMFKAHDADPANCVAPGCRSCPWRQHCRRMKDKSCPRHLVQDGLFAQHCQSGGNG